MERRNKSLHNEREQKLKVRKLEKKVVDLKKKTVKKGKLLLEKSNQLFTAARQRTKQYNSSLVDSRRKLIFAENKYIGLHNQITVL